MPTPAPTAAQTAALTRRINHHLSPQGRRLRRCPDGDPMRLRAGAYFIESQAGLVVQTHVDPQSLARSLGLTP